MSSETHLKLSPLKGGTISKGTADCEKPVMHETAWGGGRYNAKWRMNCVLWPRGVPRDKLCADTIQRAGRHSLISWSGPGPGLCSEICSQDVLVNLSRATILVHIHIVDKESGGGQCFLVRHQQLKMCEGGFRCEFKA